ncbi:MAG TPA: dodecin family protein [Candidatus Sumerlaeota bacterium]|nr:dodecin family protein [Candidatus Sumerlaeota bacterium]
MYHMIEVVGTSPAGFSEAVKNAVEGIISAGSQVHWFEIVEQRGAVRGGKLSEFQVKLKVAVTEAARTAPQGEAICPTCQKPAGEHGHMCVPLAEHDHTCDWCGALIPDESHLCSDKIKEIAFICNSCGRTAVRAEHLCNPKKIE